MCRCFHFITFRRLSFVRLEEFVNLVFPSLFWSSHWSVCLVLGVLSLSIARLEAMQSSLPDAISFFSVQHGISAAFILSMAIAVLLFMYSIHCVKLFSRVFDERDVTVLVAVCVCTATLSSIIIRALWFALSSSPLSSFLLVCDFFLYFLCLDDEVKHFLLSRSYHFFVFP